MVMEDNKETKHNIGDLLLSKGVLGQIIKEGGYKYQIYWFHEDTDYWYLSSSVHEFKQNLSSYIKYRDCYESSDR